MMKLDMETTIGFVGVDTEGHYIHIYSSHDAYEEGVVNLWDYEKDQLKMEPNISNVFREVIATLRDYFDDFEILSCEIQEINLYELLEPEVIKSLRLGDNPEHKTWLDSLRLA